MKFLLVIYHLVNLCLSFELSSDNSVKEGGCPSTSNPKILIESFHIKINDAHDLILDLDATISDTVTSATASLTLSLFQSDLLTVPVDLCSSLLNKSICPIQPGSFKQNYTLTLPNAVGQIADTLNKIPGSDIKARMNVVDSQGENLGCVAIGINNPVSINHPVAKAATVSLAGLSAGLALTSGVLSLIISLPNGLQFRPGPTPSFFDMVSCFQFISVMGQLKLSYPSVLQDFTYNFGWSMGFFKIPGIKYTTTTALKRRDFSQLLIPNDASSYSELAGVASYARKLDISVQDYFVNVLIIVGLLIGVTTILVLVLRVILELLAQYKPSLFFNLRNHYSNYYMGNLLRVFTLAYFVIATAALYQLTLPNRNTAITVVAGLILGGFCIFLMGFVAYLILRTGSHRLYSEPKFHYRYGALYSDFRQPVYTYFIVVIVASLLRALAIGGLGNYIWVQLGILAATEFFVCVGLFWSRPYATRIGNNLMIFVSVIRVANTLLLFFFIQSLFLPSLARTLLSIAIMILQGITLLGFTVMTLWNLTITIIRLVKNEQSTTLKSNLLEEKEYTPPPRFPFGPPVPHSDNSSLTWNMESPVNYQPPPHITTTSNYI